MKRRFRRYFWRVFGLFFLAVILLVLAAFLFPQQILTVDSGPVTADAMVVLGGTSDRAVRAAELFKQGAAPKILVSGNGNDISNMKLLERDGVTNRAIILEGKSRTTRENAEFSIPLLRQMGAQKVIIVTSWYHSRRALACFERSRRTSHLIRARPTLDIREPSGVPKASADTSNRNT